MGIFILLAVLETVLAVCCFVKKSYCAKERNLLRMGSFAGFVLLVVSSVISWDFRFAALGLFLLILSGIGVARQVRNKEKESIYSTMPMVFRTVGMVALLFLVSLPAMLFPQKQAVVPVTGKYQVSTRFHTYVDTDRVESGVNTGEFRKLNVQFRYPERLEGTAPLILFSHGGLATKTSNESLFNELASHGYVVCSVDHPNHSLFTTDEHGKTTRINPAYMQELLSEDARKDPQQSLIYYQKWMKTRTADLAFVLDTIRAEVDKAQREGTTKQSDAGTEQPEGTTKQSDAGTGQPESVNTHTDDIYGIVDSSRIGVMGHSLGGSAALGLGRTRGDVAAVIALESPFMCDIEGVEVGRFVFTEEPYPVPVLNVYSDSAWHILAHRPQYAANDAMLTDEEENTNHLYIKGIGHLGLTDFPLVSPFLSGVLDGTRVSEEDTIHGLEAVNRACLAFFDRTLKE